MESKKSFLAGLFDLSFSEFVTIKVIKVIYFLLIVLSAIYAIVFIGAGFGQSGGAGFVALILSPLVFLLAVLYFRICMELVIVIFRIGENTTKLVEMKENHLFFYLKKQMVFKIWLKEEYKTLEDALKDVGINPTKARNEN